MVMTAAEKLDFPITIGSAKSHSVEFNSVVGSLFQLFGRVWLTTCVLLTLLGELNTIDFRDFKAVLVETILMWVGSQKSNGSDS